MDYEQFRLSVEYFLVPLAGTLNMKRREGDTANAPSPLKQFGAALLTAVIIGGISGTASGLILTARLEERIDAAKAHIKQVDDRLTYIERHRR